jgi:Ser-tRNA(Ala) deacylase AlaX
MATDLLYHRDSGLSNTSFQVLGTGTDENGSYLIPDRTVFYYGGGGQPPDRGWITNGAGKQVPISRSIPVQEGLAHYLNEEGHSIKEGDFLQMSIDPDRRQLHCRIHTAGHLLSSVLFERLKWPLMPLKGYHYPDSPYVEFSNPRQLSEFDPREVEAAMNELIGNDNPIKISMDGSLDNNHENTFVPEGFQINSGQSMRWVGIDGFRYYPCAGTHVPSLGALEKVSLKYFKSKKGNIRAAYQVGTDPRQQIKKA